MSTVVNVHQAKTHLSRLLERVRAGEEIVLAKAGTPVARLVPIAPAVERRVPGGAEGEVVIRDDFDDPMPEEFLEALGEGPIEP